MANRIVRVCGEHGGQVTLLEHPDTVVVQKAHDVLNEIEGAFEVVEHRDRCDHLRLLRANTPPDCRSRKKLRYQLDSFFVVLTELGSRWVDADTA